MSDDHEPTDPASPGEAIPNGPSTEPAAVTEPAELRRSVEAILFLADEPVDVATLAEAVEQPPDAVERAVEQLAEQHVEQRRGTEVRAVAGGWRMYTSPAAKPAIERWALAGRTGRLTQAALETLAVIAYKQPISRQGIGDIRGVNADGAVRNLVARGLVEEVGRDEGPGQAVLYGTTRLLLERLGLGSLDELPELTDFLPEAPAPDEPDLGALKEVRRRLAAGGDLPSSSLGGRTAEQTNTGVGDDRQDDDDEDEDAMPPPDRAAGRGRDDASMQDLTDRLEHAARNAMDRLRAVTEAGDGRDDAEDGVDGADGDGPEAGGRKHTDDRGASSHAGHSEGRGDTGRGDDSDDPADVGAAPARERDRG